MRQEQQMLVAGTLFHALAILLTAHTPFFWDTILTSTIAQWFYHNGIGNLIIPEIWDAGHPPFFQVYLSGLWKIFGMSLSISHWAMFPFLMGMTWAFVQLTTVFTENALARWTTLGLYIAHPYLLTQSTLVSHDIPMTCFFLMTVLAGIRKDRWLLLLAVAGLSSISLRGQVAGFSMLSALLLFHFRTWSWLIPAFLAWGILSLGWHGYHYLQTGWLLSTPSTTWEGQRGLADLHGILSNFKGLIRGMVDYGAVIVSAVGMLGLIHMLRRSKPGNSERVLLVLSGAAFFLLALSLLPFSNPVAHRYFMPYQAILALTGGIYLGEHLKRRWLLIPIFLLMISGHWWLYPQGRSNGWDVTLAHWPYHANRQALFNDMEDRKDVVSGFPLFCSLQQTDLASDTARLLDLGEMKGSGTHSYLAWSRVCNDLRDVDVRQLGNPVRVYGKGATAIRLYVVGNHY